MMILAQLLAEKIYHDISGIVSGLSISLDNMHHPNKDIRDLSKEILSNASNSLTHKVPFFKELYRYSNALEEEISVKYLMHLIEDFLQETNKNIKCTTIQQSNIANIYGKLILIMTNISSKEPKLEEMNLQILQSEIKFKITFFNQITGFYEKINKAIQLPHEEQFNEQDAEQTNLSIRNIDLYYMNYLINQANTKSKISISLEDKHNLSMSIKTSF